MFVDRAVHLQSCPVTAGQTKTKSFATVAAKVPPPLPSSSGIEISLIPNVTVSEVSETNLVFGQQIWPVKSFRRTFCKRHKENFLDDNLVNVEDRS
jgi:hypothetical protein